MSIFGGQYGSFGGGYMTGQDGRSSAPSMQFGGGFLQAPQGGGVPVQGVVQVSGEVVYAMDPTSVKPKDRSGRRAPYERKGGSWPFDFPVSTTATPLVHRQKKY
jgi:hypothetical protein